jgi:uncharacterized protein DUF6263
MNMWRWVGSMVLVTGLFLVVSIGTPVSGQDKEKDKDKKAATPDAGKEKEKEKEKDKDKEPVKAPEKAPEKAADSAFRLKAFEGKNSFYQELTTDTTQVIKVMGQEVKQEQKQTFYVKWTPVSFVGDTIVVNQQIVGIKMKIDIGGNTISYDSVDTTSKNPMTDFFNALLKSELTLTIDAKTLKVTDVKGASALIEKLSGTNIQLAPLLKSILSDDAIKQMTEPTWGAVPTTAVKKGDTWTKSLSLNLGGIGTYDTKYTYTLDSEDAKEAKIGIKADLTYTAPTDKKSLPFKINSADLKSTEATGSAVFSKEKGRIESCNMNMKLHGTLNIEISGMTADVTLDQTQVSTVKTTDTDPLPAPAKKS